MKNISLVIAAILGITATQDAEALWGRSKEREDRGFSCETVCTKNACDKDPTVRQAARDKCKAQENGCARPEKKPMGKYKIQNYMDDKGSTNWDQFFSDACSKTPTNLATSKPKPQAVTPTVVTKPIEVPTPTPTLPDVKATPLPETPAVTAPLTSSQPDVKATPLPETPAVTAPPAPPAPPAPALPDSPSSPAKSGADMPSDLQSQIQSGVSLKKSGETPKDQKESKSDLTNILKNSPAFKSLEEQRKQEEKENSKDEHDTQDTQDWE